MRVNGARVRGETGRSATPQAIGFGRLWGGLWGSAARIREFLPACPPATGECDPPPPLARVPSAGAYGANLPSPVAPKTPRSTRG